MEVNKISKEEKNFILLLRFGTTTPSEQQTPLASVKQISKLFGFTIHKIRKA